MKKISLIVNKDGSVKVDFEGFQGASCEDELRQISAKYEGYGLMVNGIKSTRKPGSFTESEIMSKKGNQRLKNEKSKEPSS